MIDPIVLLVNPAAGGGRGRKLVNRAYAALRTVGPVEIMESERPGDESRHNNRVRQRKQSGTAQRLRADFFSDAHDVGKQGAECEGPE